MSVGRHRGPPCRSCCLGDCGHCSNAAECSCERPGHAELVRGVTPAVCGACATSSMTEPHCKSPRCSWLWCKACRLVTGIVPTGEVRTMQAGAR